MVGDEGSADGRGRGLRVVGSSPTVVVGVGVTARGGTGTPARPYRIDPQGPVLLGVSVGPVFK